MGWMGKRAAASVGVVLALAGGAAAGPLRAQWVSPDATWVAHVDAEALLGSQIGQRFLELAGGEIRAEMDGVHEELGIDPLRDVFGVTAFGVREDETTVTVVVEATPVVDQLLERANEFGEQYRSFTEGDKTIHTWEDDEHTVFAYVKNSDVANRRLVLISTDLVRLRSGMLRLEARGMGAETPAPLELAKPSAGSFLFVSASEIPGIDDDAPPIDALMRHAKGGFVEISEIGEKFIARAQLDTGDAQAAQDAVAMAQGFIAMGRMAASGEPQAKAMLPLFNGLTIAADGGVLKAKFEYDSAALIDVARQLHDEEEHHGMHEDDDVHVKVQVEKKTDRRESVQ